MGVFEDLYPIFYPESVAVVGASNQFRKSGFFCMESIISRGKYKGKIYPINRSGSEVFGLKSYLSFNDVPDKIDLAIITVPTSAVLEVIEDCGKCNVKGAVIITAGFKEAESETGEQLQAEIASRANYYGIKIIGPNTFGVINPLCNLNASFTSMLSDMKKGNIALISQSGGICHFFSYIAMDDKIGLSKVMSLGNRCNVEFVDLLEFLEKEDATKVIALYLEGLENPRDLYKIAKKIVKNKPIVAYKGGTTKRMEQITRSHTGTLASSFEICKGMFSQAGITLAGNSTELFDIAKIFSLSRPPKGNRIAVCSPIAGPGIVMTDTLIINGMNITKFTDQTNDRLAKLLPPYTYRYNPIDMPFTQDIETISAVIDCVIADDNIDSLGFVICQQEMFTPLCSGIAHALVGAKNKYNKPVAVAMIAQAYKFHSERLYLQDNSIPVYPTPERTARALSALAEYGNKIHR